jgi:hypothetical protein
MVSAADRSSSTPTSHGSLRGWQPRADLRLLRLDRASWASRLTTAPREMWSAVVVIALAPPDAPKTADVRRLAESGRIRPSWLLMRSRWSGSRRWWRSSRRCAEWLRSSPPLRTRGDCSNVSAASLVAFWTWRARTCCATRTMATPGSWVDGRLAGRRRSRWARVSRSRAAKLYRSGQPERVDDYGGVAGELAARLRRFGIKSAVGAPVRVAGRLWGALMAVDARPALRVS